MKRDFLIIACLLCYMPVIWALDKTTYPKSRALFVKAEQYIKDGNEKKYLNAIKRLKSYPLRPYLEYAWHKKYIKKLSAQDLEKFAKKYKDSVLSRFLRERWLLYQAGKGRWENFRAGFMPTKRADLNCYQQWADYELDPVPSKITSVASLWLVGHVQPKACDLLFQEWARYGALDQSQVWARIELAMQNKHYSLAKYLAKKLPLPEHKIFQLWLTLKKSPNSNVDVADFSEHPMLPSILFDSVTDLWRYDHIKAQDYWLSLTERFPNSHRASQLALQQLVLFHALSRRAGLSEWFARLDNAYVTDRLLAWVAKYYMGNGQWETALDYIHRLPEQQQAQPGWQYWKARAWQVRGFTEESQQAFKALAEGNHYYAFLAQHQLKQPIRVKYQAHQIDKNAFKALKEMPAVRRVYELLLLDRHWAATHEWQHFLDQLEPSKVAHAAALVREWDWHTTSVRTMNHTFKKGLTDLHYPAPYDDLVQKNAKRFEVEQALLHGVMRQESGFYPNAASSAGAIGLMQVLPSTAKHISNRLSIKYKGAKTLKHPKVNIRLGSAYFKYLFEKLDQHTVLAIAAYNAGPGRVSTWLPEKSMPADMWIELVPYFETRAYLKKVLMNMVVYQSIAGKEIDLNAWMPEIGLPKITSHVGAEKLDCPFFSGNSCFLRDNLEDIS